ncbi:MAG TPA: hypothetical protein VF950_12955 [Planctomycetota bacterium]
MHDAGHRKALGVVVAGGILAAAAAAGFWTWTNERWWRRSPPDGQVLVALRFPADFVPEKDAPQFSDLLAGSFSRNVAPLLRHECRHVPWPSYVGFRFLLNEYEVLGLERFAENCVALFDNTFSHDALLLIRSPWGDVERVIRAYRAP